MFTLSSLCYYPSKMYSIRILIINSCIINWSRIRYKQLSNSYPLSRIIAVASLMKNRVIPNVIKTILLEKNVVSNARTHGKTYSSFIPIMGYMLPKYIIYFIIAYQNCIWYYMSRRYIYIYKYIYLKLINLDRPTAKMYSQMDKFIESKTHRRE